MIPKGTKVAYKMLDYINGGGRLHGVGVLASDAYASHHPGYPLHVRVITNDHDDGAYPLPKGVWASYDELRVLGRVQDPPKSGALR